MTINTPTTTTRSPLIQLCIAMLFIGTSGIFGRFVPLPAPLAVWWRAAIALVALLGYCWYAGIDLRLKGKKQTTVVLLSGLLMSAHWLTYFEALQRSSVAIGMLAIFTYPAMTTLLEPLFFRKPFEGRHLLLAGLVVLGVYFLAPAFSLEDGATVGLLFGMGSALIYSLRNLLVKTQIGAINGSAVMTWQAGIATVVVLPVLFIYREWPTAEAWPFLLGLGILTTAVGHTLFLGCFRYFSVSTVSILSCVQPVYGIVLAMVFFKEVPTWSAVGGGALILLAVAVEAWFTTRKSGKADD